MITNIKPSTSEGFLFSCHCRVFSPAINLEEWILIHIEVKAVRVVKKEQEKTQIVSKLLNENVFTVEKIADLAAYPSTLFLISKNSSPINNLWKKQYIANL